MNLSPAYRTPAPRKSRSKRPPRISPENWRVIVYNKRLLGYALYRGWIGEAGRSKMRAAALKLPEILGGLRHL
jgi:hypothetical protein